MSGEFSDEVVADTEMVYDLIDTFRENRIGVDGVHEAYSSWRNARVTLYALASGACSMYGLTPEYSWDLEFDGTTEPPKGLVLATQLMSVWANGDFDMFEDMVCAFLATESVTGEAIGGLLWLICNVGTSGLEVADGTGDQA